MTKTELKTNWNKVLELLEEHIDSLNIENFFRPLSPVKLSEREKALYLVALNPPFYKTIVDRHEEELKDAIEKVFGKAYSIILVESEPEDAEESCDSMLNPLYTFETFVPGINSKMAYSAALAVAEGYERKFNPLFLYGGSGLGKTHLLHAIGQYVKLHKKNKKILYVNAETFTNEFILALQTKKMDAFREKYRKLDYLLFDDVQFIQGKEETELELFNTFQALYSANKQIVFTSDLPPKDLGAFPERLITRFAWGIIADVQPPTYETRLAILKNKAIIEELDLTDQDLLGALDLIATGIQSNIRELESALTRVITFSAFTGEKITRDFARKVLSDVYETNIKEIKPEDIKKAVANHYKIKVSEMESSSRAREIAIPRQVAIYLIKEKTKSSYPQIAKMFGGRDHTSILYSYNKVKEELEHDEELKTVITNIENSL